MTAGPLASERGAEQASALLELGVQACQAYHRPDLAARLLAAQRRLTDPVVQLVVVGEFKQGKSSLVNALVGVPACPVDDDIATAVPTYVRYGSQLRAELLVDGAPPGREPIAVDQVRGFVVEGGGGVVSDADPQRRVVGVEIAVAHELLAGGLVVVDTPGVGGLASAHAAASLAALALADAALFVTDASQELTRSELDFLRQARSACDTVACVLTKTDFFPGWRTVRDLDAAHLGPAAAIPLIAVSSALRVHAVRTDDDGLNEESGFAELVRFITGQVVGAAVARAAQAAAADVAAACEQIIRQLEAEQAALGDPAAAGRVLAGLTATLPLLDALTTPAAPWRQILAEGVAGLAAELDQDLGDRIRRVVAAADEAISGVEPGDAWPQLRPWLQSRVSRELVNNHSLLRLRADELTGRVARSFAEVAGAGTGVGAMAMAALRNAYGGAPSFTMLGSVAGIVLDPLGSGGSSGGTDGCAKNAIRRYCDEVSAVAGRDARDALGRIEQQLAAEYRARAGELRRCAAQAREALAVPGSATAAATRPGTVEAELARLRELREQAGAVAG